MRVGDRDGCGLYGLLDLNDDGLLLCHECGKAFTHLGLNAWKDHGLKASEYRERHGLSRSTGLVAPATRQKIVENAMAGYEAREGFRAARSPKKALAARLATSKPITPAGLEAIRAEGRSRKGKRRLGTVVQCERCGATFCPLTAAKKRRFCSRACALAMLNERR